MAQDDTTRLIKTMVELRRSRPPRFPHSLFGGELAWDMLLELFLADAEGERLIARQLIRRGGGDLRTGERWLAYLIAERLVAREGSGQIDDVVTPTPEAVQAIEEWAETMLEPLRAFSRSSVA